MLKGVPYLDDLSSSYEKSQLESSSKMRLSPSPFSLFLPAHSSMKPLKLAQGGRQVILTARIATTPQHKVLSFLLGNWLQLITEE